MNPDRARRGRSCGLVVSAALVVLLAVPAAARQASTADVFPVERVGDNVPARGGAAPDYVHGRRLAFGTGIERLGGLRAPLSAPLLGQDQPLAVASARGNQLVYHAWEGARGGVGIPVLRVYAREAGSDRVLARGAQSIAWRRDGVLAYGRAEVRRYDPSRPGALGPSYGQVVVRRSLGADPVPWTAEQRRRYVVLGWARGTLLVKLEASNLQRDRRPPGVYALDGPRDLRPLPIRDLVAISPDGRRAVGSFGPGDGAAREVRLVEVANGRIVAALALPFVAGYGDWAGGTVVASAGVGRRSELVILRIARGGITLRQRLRLGTARALRGASGPFLSAPIFVGADRYLIARVTTLSANDHVSFTGFVTCDRSARRCWQGRNLLPATVWAAIIDNPSRPE